MKATRPASQDSLQFNREVIGRDYFKATHTVTREMVLGFSNAIGETNPLFVDEEAAASGPHGDIIAPPSLVASFVRLDEPADLNLQFDGTIYMAGQWVEPLLPSVPATS